MAPLAKRSLLALPVLALAQIDLNNEWDGCTSIIVDSKATVDGAALTSHANDCADCDWRMSYVAAQDHPEGAKRTVFEGGWGQYPRLVDPRRSPLLVGGAGINESKVTGEIPQVAHTYAMWESSYSLINEKGLAFGESTCSAHLVGTSTLSGGDALFAIRQLMAVGMERCATARCAIQTMGDLAAEYGFYGEDPGKGGAGESVQIVDAAGEAWVFHLSGGVPTNDTDAAWKGQRGALWAAQRVPSGHVAVVANNFIIREVDPADKDNFMVHPGLFELAQEAGLWDGEGAFDFQKIMAPDIRYFSYNPLLPPIPMYATIRMWWVFRNLAPSLKIDITKDAGAYPFSVPVDRKVELSQVMDLFRTHYEGTDFDMRLGALAGPYQSPNRAEGGAGVRAFPGQFARSPSIPRTSYTQVSQAGPGVEPIVWFSPDCAASSVFVPFFARTLRAGDGDGAFDVPSFGIGSMKELSFTDGTPPAWWAFDFVANWMEISYKNMSETYVYPKVQQAQREMIAQAAAAVDAAKHGDRDAGRLLAREQTRMQRQITEDWWKFATTLVVRYNDGFFNFGPDAPTKAAPIGYPAFWLEMVGFDRESYYPTWFSRVPRVPQLLPAHERALAEKSIDVEFSEVRSTLPATWTGYTGCVTTLLALCVGYLLGQRKSTAQKANEGAYVRVAA